MWYWRMKSGNQLALTSGTLRRARAEACRQGRVGWGAGCWSLVCLDRKQHMEACATGCSFPHFSIHLCSTKAPSMRCTNCIGKPQALKSRHAKRTLITKSLSESLPPLLAASDAFSCCLQVRAACTSRAAVSATPAVVMAHTPQHDSSAAIMPDTLQQCFIWLAPGQIWL